VTPGRGAAALLTGLALGGVAVLVAGLTALDGAVVAVAGAVLVLAAGALEGGEEHGWPPVPHRESDGARPAVSALMWSFAGRDGKVSEAGLRALRRQAGRRLAGEGIVLDDGAGHLVSAPGGPRPGDDTRARELLGERAWRVLTHRGDLPSVADVAHCVDVVERLTPGERSDPTHPGGHP
jgi:hypothetical protein